MSVRLNENLGRFWTFSSQWLKQRGMEFVRCRQCSHSVQFLEDICPHCGASSPARVSASLMVLVAGVIGVLFVTCCLIL